MQYAVECLSIIQASSVARMCQSVSMSSNPLLDAPHADVSLAVLPSGGAEQQSHILADAFSSVLCPLEGSSSRRIGRECGIAAWQTNLASTYTIRQGQLCAQHCTLHIRAEGQVQGAGKGKSCPLRLSRTCFASSISPSASASIVLNTRDDAFSPRGGISNPYGGGCFYQQQCAACPALQFCSYRNAWESCCWCQCLCWTSAKHSRSLKVCVTSTSSIACTSSKTSAHGI